MTKTAKIEKKIGSKMKILVREKVNLAFLSFRDTSEGLERHFEAEAFEKLYLTVRKVLGVRHHKGNFQELFIIIVIFSTISSKLQLQGSYSSHWGGYKTATPPSAKMSYIYIKFSE